MSGADKDRFAAGEQALGYIYQLRYALYRLLGLPESEGIFIERRDDVESIGTSGDPTLASLKHKKMGDKVTDLSVDFWKSIRIWLKRYSDDGKTTSHARFFMVTTAKVSEQSFIASLLPDAEPDNAILEKVLNALNSSTSVQIQPIDEVFRRFSESEQRDFLSRITVFDNSPRIGDIPSLILEEHFKAVRRKFRSQVFEHLEGWWVDQAIKLIDGLRPGPITGAEVWDRLTSIADGYRDDDLPINFAGKRPPEGVDAEGDQRPFVKQLRAIGVSTERIHHAIIDYYRAFEQRSAWAREGVLLGGEVEEYEDKLIEEWSRYRAVVIESLPLDAAEAGLMKAGQDIYKWAEFDTSGIRIRARVNEPYVVRGGFHILANSTPKPRIYWHPRFLDRLAGVLGVQS
jgi:hypothetical protein